MIVTPREPPTAPPTTSAEGVKDFAEVEDVGVVDVAMDDTTEVGGD